MLNKKIILESIPEPQVFERVAPTFLNAETIAERKQKLLQRMSEENFEALIIYADKEHASNFEYLTGFIPRFEEGLLVVENPEKFTLILGNENLKLCAHARVPADLIHYPQFSLPNQPMENEKTLESIFLDLGIAKKKRVGVIGWKMFTTKQSDPSTLFDVPYFIVDALKNTIPTECELVNGAYVMIGDNGVRTTNNANEIAHYEYGANLSSRCMLRAMNAIEPGCKETEIGNLLNADGQYNSVVTIAAAGQRFELANIYPTHKEIQLGEPMSLTTGFKGGLSSRTGFVVEQAEQLPFPVLSIYGSEDEVLNRESYGAAQVKLPDDYTEIVLEGGNHGQFGDYGTQSGDGTATIATVQQQQQTVEAITTFIEKNR